MARPTTKADLLEASSKDYAALMTLIQSMTDDQQKANFTFDPSKAGKEAHWQRDHNLRDVLIHLYEWHQLLLGWIKTNQAGQNQPFLPAPYNWRTYGDMNIKLWEKHQTTSLEDARTMLINSHKEVITIFENLSNEDLFSKEAFTWTGNTTLGQYCASATTSHYKWALKKVKLQLRQSK